MFHMAFPCILSERINTLRTILINSAKLINQSTGKEKVVAQYMFATAFCNIIRNGTVYRRGDGIDGTPRLVIMLGNTEYKCPEYLVEKLINKNFVITPYEDTSQHLDGLDILPKPDFIDLEELSAQSPKKKNKKTEIEKKAPNSDNPENEPKTDDSTKDEISQKVEMELEKEKAKLQKKMDAQLAMDRKKQEELIIDEIDNTKMYKIVNIALCAFCTAASIAIWVFL